MLDGGYWIWENFLQISNIQRPMSFKGYVQEYDANERILHNESF